MAAFGWSWLPPELFSAIFDRLSVVDRTSCHCVCRSWRKAAQEKPIRRPPLESPWLMFSDPNKGCNFYSITNNKSYHMDMDLLPDIRDHTWIGSSDGRLITADKLSELHLLNPITHEHIPLPSILTLPSVAAVRDPEGNLTDYIFSFEERGIKYLNKFSLEETRRYLFCNCKAAVSWCDSNNSWVVMLMFRPGPKLACAWAGDDAWTIVVNHGFWHDLILHNGLFYALMPHYLGYIVEVWDLTSAHPSLVRTITVDILNDDPRRNFYPYLVISSSSTGSKQLLLVNRERNHFSDDKSYETRSFEVYMLDDGGSKPRPKPKWMRMQSLGDQALFVGSNSCRSFCTLDFPNLKKNCIYFTDDNWEAAVDAREETRDIGVCNLEDEGISPCYPGDIPKLNWPPPVWITPSLR